MKVKTGLMLREIAGQWIIVPLGQRTVEFNAIMNLSETGAVIWKALEEGMSTDSVVERIVQEYEIDSEAAKEDVHLFIALLKDKGLVEE